MGAEHWDEQVGSVADEATRLLQSLRRSAADAAAGSGRHPRRSRRMPVANRRLGRVPAPDPDRRRPGEGDGATASSRASGAGAHALLPVVPAVPGEQPWSGR